MQPENMVNKPSANDPLTGGCQCGALRYRITAALGNASICHCRMCQKAFGSFGAALVSVPRDGFAWTRGTPAEFRSSAIVARGFCSACGTPLYMLEDDYGVIEIAIGTFDDPSPVPTLAHQVGIESRLGWFSTMHLLPGKTTTDDRTAEEMKKLASRQHPDYDTDVWPLTERP